jgi:hypothetical protein
VELDIWRSRAAEFVGDGQCGDVLHKVLGYRNFIASSLGHLDISQPVTSQILLCYLLVELGRSFLRELRV